MIANKNKKIPVVTIALVLAGTLLAGCASLPASAEKIKARPAAVVLKTVKPSAVKISKNNAALMLNATSIEKNFITYINKSGYDVVKGSMTAGIKLILPKGAKLPETDSATWKFVLRRNGFSKKNGLDFSPYFGKKVALLYCDGKNRGTGKTTELLGLYYNKKLVGFWAMPRLKDVGLPDVSYKFNRDSSVLKEMWGTSGQKEVWDSYLAAWDEFSTDPAERLYTKLGYRIELNSGDEGILTLPKNFKGNSKIGQYFKDCNEKSKKNHLDFSSYLGKKVKLLSYDAEKTNGTLAYLYILYDGKKMVGFWAEQHPLSNDPRRNETYDGLLKWK